MSYGSVIITDVKLHCPNSSSPLGYITDKYQCYKLIAIVSTVICGVANALHLAVPPSQGISSIPCGVQLFCSVAKTDCHLGQSQFPSCQPKQTSDLKEVRNRFQSRAYDSYVHYVGTSVRHLTF